MQKLKMYWCTKILNLALGWQSYSPQFPPILSLSYTNQLLSLSVTSNYLFFRFHLSLFPSTYYLGTNLIVCGISLLKTSPSHFILYSLVFRLLLKLLLSPIHHYVIAQGVYILNIWFCGGKHSGYQTSRFWWKNVVSPTLRTTTLSLPHVTTEIYNNRCVVCVCMYIIVVCERLSLIGLSARL